MKKCYKNFFKVPYRLDMDDKSCLNVCRGPTHSGTSYMMIRWTDNKSAGRHLPLPTIQKKNQAGVIPRMELYRNVFVRFQSNRMWNFCVFLKKWCMLRSHSRWRGWNWTQFLILHQGTATNRLAAPITKKKKNCTKNAPDMSLQEFNYLLLFHRQTRREKNSDETARAS